MLLFLLLLLRGALLLLKGNLLVKEAAQLPLCVQLSNAIRVGLFLVLVYVVQTYHVPHRHLLF